MLFNYVPCQRKESQHLYDFRSVCNLNSVNMRDKGIYKNRHGKNTQETHLSFCLFSFSLL